MHYENTTTSGPFQTQAPYRALQTGMADMRAPENCIHAQRCSYDLQDELFYQRYALDQHAIVSLSDVQGRIISANNNLCRVSGYRRDELLGQDHAILRSGMHPKGFFRAMCDTLMRGEIWQGDICNRAKDGSLFWVSATLLMYGESDGLPTQYLSICTDITQSKANEQALRDESAIVARMSHEVHKLQRTELDPEQQRMVATIADAAQALLRLLKDSHLCP